MNYISSITSQGQLTIPKPLRDAFGITGRAKVHMSKKGNRIEIVPYQPRDIMSLYGIMKDNPVVKKHKSKPLQAIIASESSAYEQAVTKNVAQEMRS